MSAWVRKNWIAGLVGVTQLLGYSAFAQAPVSVAVPPLSNGVQSAVRAMPPLPPAVKPPVDFFRELLAATPIARNVLLANRSPGSKDAILAKVKEYEQLEPEERELRLKATELQYWLTPLLSMSVSNRDERLSLVPSKDLKQLIQDRLRQWDELSAQQQADFLIEKDALGMMVNPAGSSDAQPELRQLVERVKKTKIEAGERRLAAMSDEERQRAIETYTNMFVLSTADKTRALQTLSEPERQQIQRTLDAFGRLPAPKRAICLRSFEQFACLSPDERDQFLKNAARWESMTPSERQKWRNLVQKFSRMPPPMPFTAPPLPTVPSRLAPKFVATNPAAGGN